VIKGWNGSRGWATWTPGVSDPPPPGAADLDPATEDAIRRLARVNKIEAIKLVRQNTGWGLKQAKDYVDGL